MCHPQHGFDKQSIVSRSADRWFIAIQVKVPEVVANQCCNGMIGIDVNYFRSHVACSEKIIAFNPFVPTIAQNAERTCMPPLSDIELALLALFRAHCFWKFLCLTRAS